MKDGSLDAAIADIVERGDEDKRMDTWKEPIVGRLQHFSEFQCFLPSLGHKGLNGLIKAL